MIFFLSHLATTSADEKTALALACALSIVLLLGMAVSVLAGSARARGAACVALAAEFASAVALIQLGYVFSRVWYLVVLVLLAVGIVGVAAGFRPGFKKNQRDRSDWLGSIGAFLAIPLTVLGAVQFVLPGVAAGASGSNYCADVPVLGSKLVARTGPSGNYLRTGPSGGYEPVYRLDAACQVGADGYCIGQPTPDAQVGLPDIRWFRMRFTNLYFAAGPTVALGVDTDLDAQPTDACPKAALTDDFTAAVQAGRDPDSSTRVLFKAVGRANSLVGLATVYPASTNHAADSPGIAPKEFDSTGTAYLRLEFGAYKHDVGDTGQIVVALAPCLGPISPAPSTPTLFTVDVNTGAAKRGAPTGFDVSNSAVKFAACAVSPSAGNGQLAAAAVSSPPSKTFVPDLK